MAIHASVPTAKNNRMAARTNLALPRFGSRAVKTILSSAREGGILGVPIDSGSNTIFDAIQSCASRGLLQCPRTRRLGVLHISVIFLQDKKSFFLFSPIADQTFAIEIILDSRQSSPWTAEVFEDPGCGAAKKRDALQHRDLMPVEIFLIFFGPTLSRRAVQPKECVSAKFAHDQRLVIV